MISRRAAPLLVAVLLLAGFAALFVNQRLRREGLVIDTIHLTPVLTPGCECPTDHADISFRIKGPDAIDLDVLDSDGNRVRRIAENRELPDRVITVFRWNGKTDAGSPAPPGIYTLRVHERERDRTINPTEEMTLARGAPR
jgi:flagellar hook capping protein FlgD